MDGLFKQKQLVHPDTDGAVEVGNDLMIYQNIIEKIDDRENV